MTIARHAADQNAGQGRTTAELAPRDARDTDELNRAEPLVSGTKMILPIAEDRQHLDAQRRERVPVLTSARLALIICREGRRSATGAGFTDAMRPL